MRLRRLIGAVFAASAAVPIVLLAGAAPAQAAAVGCANEKTVITTVTDRSDGGYGSGVWAKSDFVRTVVLCEKAPIAPSAVAVTMAEYTATVHDVGTFVTLGGANLAPDHGGALIAGVTGTVDGGFTATFTAKAGFEGFDDSNLKNTTVTGDPASPQTPANPSTGQWVKSMFPAATSFNGNSLDDDSWKWTYKTCNEQWIDAADALGGHTGNITGSPACPAPTPTPASPTPTGPLGGITGPLGGVTGTDVTWYLAVGAALVVGGALFLVIGRRRRTA
jgi:LPXTG-motif cell wall-anchored protein